VFKKEKDGTHFHCQDISKERLENRWRTKDKEREETKIPQSGKKKCNKREREREKKKDEPQT